MENILIVDASSTGKNYILDSVKRGYHPVVLETRVSEAAAEDYLRGRAQLKARYSGYADYYDEQETYEETLELVRSLHPIVVISGSEDGVPLATRLADDLDLPGNPYSRLDNYIKKNCMQDALRDYGIRYIRSWIVKDKDEALKYYRAEKLQGCVVKPLRGAGSVGVRLCDNESDLLAALDETLGGSNFFGTEIDCVCLQERIVGTEYIVNTVSYEGVHRLSSVWRYEKRRVAGGGNVYDYCIAKSELTAGDNRMIRYAFDVADAIGIKFGAVHGEYMVDEKGPVLIEVNCRAMGGGMADTYVDRIFGHHETDNILDTYLNPAWHYEETKKNYRARAYGAFKFFIMPEDMHAEAAPVMNIIRRLKSYHSAVLGAVTNGDFHRTVDLETSGGTVFLVHEDERVLLKDLEFLRKVESKYLNMLFSRPINIEEKRPKKCASVHDVLRACECSRSVLVATNDPAFSANVMVVPAEDVSKALGGYDWGVLDLNYREDEDIETIIETFYALVSKVRRGGRVVVPERTYWHLPCGMESVEILFESLGLRIEAPAYGTRGVVIATVE